MKDMQLLVFSALLQIYPSWQHGDSFSNPSVYDDVDAYEVYSAALPLDSAYQDSKTVLILQTVPPSEWPIGSARDALHGKSEFSKAFAPIFDSFDQANEGTKFLEHHFSFPKPYRLLGKDELETAFKRRTPHTVDDDGWSGFRDAFPDSRGYLILSAVGFSADKTLALVYIEHRCGGLCAEARYVILQKQNGRWVQYTPKGVVEMRGIS